MIGYLCGKLIKKTSSSILVDVNGVGYRVNVLPDLLNEFNLKTTVRIYTHQYVREDQISLYGFKSYSQLENFEILISISGIGPKLAFNIVSKTTREELISAVTNTDTTILSRIPGIGKKSASKILLELSNKLKIDQDLKKIIMNPEEELAVEALTNLGFKRSDSQKAIQQSAKNFDKLEDKITAGLKYLNSN